MSTLANQPAFPTRDNAVPEHQHEGMTLRQYYAGLAMQGMLSCSIIMEDMDKLVQCSEPALNLPEIVAKGAVDLADALIAQLEKESAS